ncbi:MAG TPA: helicase-associated domain-containing protein [Streptosporangiales bacterium]
MTRDHRSTGLAAWLSDRTDGELAGLFAARPDLLNPVPPDFGRLAHTASTRASLQLAVEQLDTLALRTLRALSVADGPVSYDELAATLGAPPGGGRLRETVDLLRARALCHGDDAALATPGELRRIPLLPAELGPSVTHAIGAAQLPRLKILLEDLGLVYADEWQGRRELARYFETVAHVRDLLGDLSDKAVEALRLVAASGGYGRVDRAHRAVSITTATGPIDELLARGLLLPQGDEHVVLPFEVAVALPQEYEEPPPVSGATHDASFVDRTGGMHANAFVQAVDDLLTTWADTPPSRLRSGGLGVRDLRAAARLLDATTEYAALVVETAWAAGLLDCGYPDDEWLPTEAYDTWRALPVAARWTQLASTWLTSMCAPGLVGQKDERNRTINALTPDTRPLGAARVRRACLEQLAGLPAGTSVPGDALVERIAWMRPHLASRSRRQLCEWTFREAEQLGVSGQGALTGYGRELLAGGEDVAAALDRVLPELGHEVLVQPDLTAVAPGPLHPAVRSELGLLADVESTGGATVYRFTPASVRRALDAGRTAAELREWLGAHSRTEVPQPLHYLIDDVARRHGRLRAGTATSYVRCDDEALLSEIMAHRKADRLAARRIAPTVLVSQLGRAELLDELRELGFAPVAESVAGDVVVTAPQARRTRSSGPAATRRVPDRPSAHLVEQAVQVLRAGERLASARPHDDVAPRDNLPRNPHRETLAAIHDAIDDGGTLWIGYANAEGRASLRLIEPVAVLGGLVEAYDHLRETRSTFALHRITGYAVVDPLDTTA